MDSESSTMISDSGCPGLECRRVHEGLEDRARLAARLVHPVELAVVEVAAAYPGADVACLGLEGEHEPLQVRRHHRGVGNILAPLEILGVGAMRKLPVARPAGLDGRELALERTLGGLLHVEVERGVDAQPLAIKVLTEAGLHLLAHVLDEVLRGAAEVGAGREQQRKGAPALGFLVPDQALVTHEADDEVPALDASRGTPARVVGRRRLRDRRQRRGLGDVQLAGALAEVALACDLDAVGAIAEVDLVEVQLEDLVLAVALLDVECDAHLPQLPAQAAVAAVDVLGKEVAGELHGDGGRTGDPSAKNGTLGGTEDPDPVDAVMLVEALVLRREEGLDDGRRNLVEGHHGACVRGRDR